MTDKELHRLKRAELLEILFYLQKEIDNLKEQNQKLQERIENLAVNKQSLSDEDLNRISQIIKDALNLDNKEDSSEQPENVQERSD